MPFLPRILACSSYREWSALEISVNQTEEHGFNDITIQKGWTYCPKKMKLD